MGFKFNLKGTHFGGYGRKLALGALVGGVLGGMKSIFDDDTDTGKWAIMGGALAAGIAGMKNPGMTKQLYKDLNFSDSLVEGLENFGKRGADIAFSSLKDDAAKIVQGLKKGEKLNPKEKGFGAASMIYNAFTPAVAGLGVGAAYGAISDDHSAISGALKYGLYGAALGAGGHFVRAASPTYINEFTKAMVDASKRVKPVK